VAGFGLAAPLTVGPAFLGWCAPHRRFLGQPFSHHLCLATAGWLADRGFLPLGPTTRAARANWAGCWCLKWL